MKGKKKKIIKTSVIIATCLLIATIFSFVGYVSISFSHGNYVTFDKTKITDYSLSIDLYDKNDKLLDDLNTFNGNYVYLKSLPEYVPQCFISIEDKRFYQHSGIDYKRMISATLKNIVTFGFNQGASTISQQLIKNTHLTNEKTIKRKINEIMLTKQMENQLSKNQILEYYLNIIYFGDNCYGIENASKHYFNKSSKDLNIEESATLAGMIKSPYKYHPIKKNAISKKRRNIVLKEMLKDNNISLSAYNDLVVKPLTTTSTIISNNLNTYSNSAISEACEILKMPAKQIAIGKYKVYTYLNPDKQYALTESINDKTNSDYQMISINNNTLGIEAYMGKSNLNLLNVKRQPASCIKPILVYGPSINDNVICPQTQILDEKIDISGYAPKNVGLKYHGYVSAKTALASSLNVPAIKVMTYTGIDRCKSYANKCGIEFSDEDNNLSIALGGMKYGTSLKDLTNSYTVLANKGKFAKATFIAKITDKYGYTVYEHKQKYTQVFRDDTAYLVTDMLKYAVSNGTAKGLNQLNYEVASKTGTNNVSGKNIDAYNISYTNDDLVGIWFGNVDNSEISCMGGGMPTRVVKEYFERIYKNKTPKNFDMPSSCTYVDIDTVSLKEDHIVAKACEFTPKRYVKNELFSKFNLPNENYGKFVSVEVPTIYGKINSENKIEISFKANNICTYEIYKITDRSDIKIDEISYQSGNVSLCYDYDKNESNKYYILCKIKNYSTNCELCSGKSNVLTFYKGDK